jgi:RNA polymerase sigma factor (TIGR02999 family)
MAEADDLRPADGRGTLTAADQILPVVYDELRRLASFRLANEPSGQTLQTTALVHEAYLRLVGSGDPGWEGKSHFFAAAAEAMRRILVERARGKNAQKRGGGRHRVALDPGQLSVGESPIGLLAVDEALDRLAAKDPRKAELFKLRYFAGLTNQEAADTLAISPRTAKRYWRYACVWLLREVGGKAE